MIMVPIPKTYPQIQIAFEGTDHSKNAPPVNDFSISYSGWKAQYNVSYSIDQPGKTSLGARSFLQDHSLT